MHAYARAGFIVTAMVLALLAPLAARAAPFAAMVIDARTGEVLHARNQDTRLHPASLTKMMTLYIAFEAIRNGEITLDTPVRISANAAGSPCSCLGLRAGQTIALRHLMRAAAVRSANDAATAIGEAISGSEAAFIARMNRTAQALGMTSTSFRNAHGLTAPGHLSTVRDMTTLGRQLFFDYPEYWNIWSRRSADAGIANVVSTNRAFLDSYEGADGIKTGFTRAAGFNLTASAQRGERHIIVTVFGGQSVPDRTRRVTELMNLGFERAPRRAAVRRPPPPNYGANPPGGVAMAAADTRPAAARTIRIDTAVRRSPVPPPRPVRAEATAVASLAQGIESAVAAVAAAPGAIAPPQPTAQPAPRPEARPEAQAATLPFALAGAPEEATTAPATPAPRPFAVAEAEAPAETGADTEAEAVERPFALAGEAEAPDVASRLAVASAPIPLPRPDIVDEGEPVATEVAEAAPATAPEPLPEPEAPVALAEAAEAPEAVEDLPTAALPLPAPATAPAAAPAPAAVDPASLVVLTFAPARAEEAGSGLASLAELGRAQPHQTEAAPRPAPAAVVERTVSTSAPRLWAVSLGRFPSRDAAERALIRSALADLGTLDSAPRRVEQRSGGFEASFVGLTEASAHGACRRLGARGQSCLPVGP